MKSALGKLLEALQAESVAFPDESLGGTVASVNFTLNSTK